MVLPSLFYVIIALILTVLGLAVVVTVGGYRSAYNLVLTRKFEKAQEDFTRIRQGIRRHYTHIIHELHEEVDEYLLRLQEARREVLRQYGIELSEKGDVMHTSLEEREEKLKSSDPLEALRKISEKLRLDEDASLDNPVLDKADKMTQALREKIRSVAPDRPDASPVESAAPGAGTPAV